MLLKMMLLKKTDYNAKVTTIEGQIAGITSLNSFNSKVTEVESKIKAADIIAKSANTKANTIRSNLTDYAKKLMLLRILPQ